MIPVVAPGIQQLGERRDRRQDGAGLKDLIRVLRVIPQAVDLRRPGLDQIVAFVNGPGPGRTGRGRDGA